MKLAKLLILGGTGFFGKSILDLFIRGGFDVYGIKEVIVAARKIDSFWLEYPELKSEKVYLTQVDLTKTTQLPHAEFVIHAATSTDARDYIADSVGQRSNIERTTENFCSLATRFLNGSKIVYCSSGAVYGKQPMDVPAMKEELPFQDVTGLVKHKQDYALGKRKAEIQIQNLGKLGLNVSIARCFAFYGKYLPKDQHFAYGNFIACAEKGEPIMVMADHKVVRTYMNADDLAHSLIRVAFDSRPECPIYNIGGAEPIEIRELAEKIGKKYGVPVLKNPIQNQDADLYVPDVSKLSSLGIPEKIRN